MTDFFVNEFVNTLNNRPISDLKQLNNIIDTSISNSITPEDHDKGTIDADNAHDGINPHFAGGSAHDISIYKKTKANDNTIVYNHPEYFEEIDDQTKNTGVLISRDNYCYIIDTIHRGKSLKGVNQFLDSAVTGATDEFIVSIIDNEYTDSKYEDVTGINKSKADELYKFRSINLFDGPRNRFV